MRVGSSSSGAGRAGAAPPLPSLACFQAMQVSPSRPWPMRGPTGKLTGGHGLPDWERRHSDAAHRRECRALSMAHMPGIDTAAFLPAAISTLTVSTETAIQTCPPLDRWRMKLYIGGVAIALLWFLGTAVVKVVARLWAACAARWWMGASTSEDVRLERENRQREASSDSVLDEWRNPSIYKTQTSVRPAARLRRDIGSTRQAAALMERAQVQSAGPAAEMWERVKGRDGDQEYMMLRHRQTKVSVELSLTGKGVLFRSGDGMVWRCWADGTFNERFSFRTGDKLLQSPKADVLTSVLGAPGGRERDGHWSLEWQRAGGLVSVVHSDGEECVYLRADGFAFFGGGTRGVLVADGEAEPQVVQESQLREICGLARVSTETRVRIQEEKKERERSKKEISTPAEQDIPKELLCGLTGALMRDPWIASDGCSYERQAILQWFASKGARSPTTGLPLPDKRLVPNNALRSIITSFIEEGEGK
jgi:hypothetical protein